VARLYSDGRFAETLRETFKGGTKKVWLAPPGLTRTGADGRPVKMAFGRWMFDVGFPMLARLKGLRGGPLDVFGRDPHRKLERQILAAFEADLDRIARELTAEKLAVAKDIAAVPQQIRGFGFVKEAAMQPAAAERARLWHRWEGHEPEPAKDRLVISRRAPTEAA
jgi:indolepyruvate ferredoxin oxidoreductase